MVTGFCEKLGWWDLEVLISGFSERLNFGVQKDILPLMQIPHIKAFRARALYNAGYKTIASIAAATPEEIGPCMMLPSLSLLIVVSTSILATHLQNAQPFKSKKVKIDLHIKQAPSF